jgi:hypothetical protein
MSACRLLPLALLFVARTASASPPASTTAQPAPAPAEQNVPPQVSGPTIAAPAVLGFPRTAFLFEARLSLGGGVAGDGGMVTQPSLFLGARIIDRIHLGAGVTFHRTAAGDAGSTNTFTVEPSVAIDIVKSQDNRTAFYIKPGIGLGAVVKTDTDTVAVVTLDLSIGVRHAFHPMFSIGLEAGIAGSWVDPGSRTTAETVVIYGALAGSFYLGK